MAWLRPTRTSDRRSRISVDSLNKRVAGAGREVDDLDEDLLSPIPRSSPLARVDPLPEPVLRPPGKPWDDDLRDQARRLVRRTPAGANGIEELGVQD